MLHFKCNKGLAEECPKQLRGGQGRILKNSVAGWHPRLKDAKLDSAAFAKVEALKLMEEADLRRSRTNVSRQKTAATPVHVND